MNAVQNVIWMCFKQSVILHTFQINENLYRLQALSHYEIIFVLLILIELVVVTMSNGGCCINVKGEDVVDCVFSVSLLTLVLHHTHCSD